MRLLLGVALLVTLAAVPARADMFDLSLGPASVGLVTAPVPACAIPVTGVPCPVGHDDADTVTPTDDTVYQYQAVEALAVTVDAPVPVPVDGAVVDFRRQRVGHGFIDAADTAFLALHAALPPALRERSFVDSGQNDTVFVFVLFEADPVTGSRVGVPVHALLPWTTREGTRIPNGLLQESSDDWGPANLRYLENCDWPQVEARFPLCGRTPLAADLPALWASLTPRLVTGAAVNVTSVALSAPQGADAGAYDEGRASLATAPGWTRGFAPAADSASPGRAGAWAPGAAAWSGMPASEGPPRDRGAHAQAVSSGAEPVLPWLFAAAAALLVLPVALYQRITRERALRHAKRLQLLELARQRPGLLMAHAAQALGLSYHTARHHARVLARCGHLQLVEAGHYVAVYPPGVVDAPQRTALAHLRRGPLAEVLRRVQARPGLRVSELAALLGTGRSSACAKLKRLERAGLVCAAGRGRYAATPHGTEALAWLDGPPRGSVSATGTGAPGAR